MKNLHCRDKRGHDDAGNDSISPERGLNDFVKPGPVEGRSTVPQHRIRKRQKAFDSSIWR
jgi:hypothetical protein